MYAFKEHLLHTYIMWTSDMKFREYITYAVVAVQHIVGGHTWNGV